MKINEIRKMTIDELKDTLKQLREVIRVSRFKQGNASSKQARRSIARAETVLRERKNNG